MITLYYIQGINRTDTPTYPATRSADGYVQQQAYFSNKVVATIENSYYPPKYRNTISISSDDVTFNTSFNYLSLYFNNKYYYYFVDDVEYVNEELMNVHVTMDVIQTYMFNMHISNAVLGRKSISRWDNNDINRNYLRENFSQGEFLFDKQYNGDNKYGGYMVVCTNAPSMIVETQEQSTTINSANLYNKDTRQCLALRYYFLPLPVTNKTSLTINNNSVDIVTQQQVLNILIKQTQVVDCFYVPDITCLNHITCSETSGEIGFTFDTNYYVVSSAESSPDSGVFGYFARVGITKGGISYPTNQADYQLISIDSYEKSTSITNTFSYTYCPQLIDSNYYKIYFGEKINVTEYPIEKRKVATLYCNYFNDVLFQKRYYWIGDGDTINGDKYMDMIVCEGNNSAITISNALNDWLSINKGTLALAPINTILGSLDFNTSETTKTKYGKGASNYGKITSRTTETGTGSLNVAGTALSIAQNVASGLAEVGNKAFTPDTIKQSPTMTIYSDEPNWVYTQYKVTDLEDCAKLYESLGYLIHEPYSKADTTHWWSNSNWTIRYYYNVVNFDDINIYLSDCPSDTSTEQLICDRLKDGVRLWRTDINTSETYLDLGQLWKFDNVEIANIE